jgi:uncharacterized protein (DUF924 family)
VKKPEDVLQYWLEEVEPKNWYIADDKIDDEIRTRFQDTWEAAARGEISDWACDARGSLAYIILLDQFPRNMFRGSGKAFSTDAEALAATKVAISKDWDLQIDEPARQFFYVPFMHSELLDDQERGLRLVVQRMPENGEENLLHAKVHREIIRLFGRFPYRNQALGRSTSEDEKQFMESGGYAKVLDNIRSGREAQAGFDFSD